MKKFIEELVNIKSGILVNVTTSDLGECIRHILNHDMLVAIDEAPEEDDLFTLLVLNPKSVNIKVDKEVDFK